MPDVEIAPEKIPWVKNMLLCSIEGILVGGEPNLACKGGFEGIASKFQAVDRLSKFGTDKGSMIRIAPRSGPANPTGL